MRSWSVLFAMGLNFTPASSSFMTWKHAYSFQQFKGTVSRVCRPFFAQKTLSLRSYFSQDTIPLKRRIHQCSNIILCGDSLYCTDILQLCNWKIHGKQTCMRNPESHLWEIHSNFNFLLHKLLRFIPLKLWGSYLTHCSKD